MQELKQELKLWDVIALAIIWIGIGIAIYLTSTVIKDVVIVAIAGILAGYYLSKFVILKKDGG